MEIQESICRLCLKVSNSCKAIEGNMENVLHKLLPKINLAATQKPVMCTNCAQELIKCFDFKVACCTLRDYTVPFVNKDNIKLNLKDVYLSKNGSGTCIPEDQVICGFCMNLVKNCSAISLDAENRDNILKAVIDKCLSQLDLSIIMKPIICRSCYGTLDKYFRFMINCLSVEEKINKYCETLDINIKGQIELNRVLQFAIGDVGTSKAEDNLVNIIKVEIQPSEGRGAADERQINSSGDIFNQMFSEDSKQEVAHEIKKFMAIEDVKLNEEQFTPKHMLTCKEECNDPSMIKTEDFFCGENKLEKDNLVEMADQKYPWKEEMEIKTDDPDFVRLEDGIVLQHPEVTTRLIPNLEADQWKPNIKQAFTNKKVLAVTMYQCDVCPFQTKYKRSHEMHLLKHKDPSKLTIFTCDFCSFQTTNKYCLKNHLVIHKDPSEITMLKCHFCLYQTKQKQYLKSHLQMHKDPSEITVYTCEFCSFQTKYKNYLKKHVMAHTNPSDLTIYKCDSCSFHTKHKNSIENHLLKHKDPSEVTMYNCHSCSYQTRHKRCLKGHLLLAHKNFSEVTMYKCDSCSFETKHKGSLKGHLLTHKNPSEVTMYKCDSCSFQAMKKCLIKSHLISHKDPSEVTMYKCDSCSFQTKHKGSLKCHLLTHKNPSEVTMYKCDSCSFQAMKKCLMKSHLLSHKNPSEVTMYKCDSCSFQTRHKRNLGIHMLVHKSASGVTMYKCDSCSFQTKWSSAFNRHLLVHKNPSEVIEYRCDSCPFQTKYKSSLKNHQIMHKGCRK